MLKELARFLPYLSGRRAALARVFALGLAGAAVALSTPLLGMAFVDAVTMRADFTAVPWIAAALVALALVDLALAAVSSRVHARLAADVLAELRAALFARCAEGPLAAVEPFRHGDLMTRFGSDVPRIQGLLVDGLLGAVQNVLFLAVAAAITFTLSSALALWSFAGLGLALLAAASFRRSVERGTHRVRDAMVDLSHLLSERLGALRAIRLHGTAQDDARALDAASGRLKGEVVRFQLVDTLASGVPGLALTLALAWIYLVGGRLIESGAISLGTFVAFVLYQGRLFAPAQGLLALVRGLQEARVSIARVSEVLGAADESTGATVQPRTAVVGNAIELEGVTFAYPGRPPVLHGADLCVAMGERVALFGASGAGKSTLVQLMFGLRAASQGSVRIDGSVAKRGRGARRRAPIGYAGGEPFLLHASIEENLRYGNPRSSRRDLERAASIADAAGFIEALPQGYATVIGGRGLALSDGQRQRLDIARLVLRNPRILVLDEAFSALDLDTEVRIRTNLWRAFPERTALVISHRPVGLADMHRIVFLRDGRLTRIAPGEAATLEDLASRLSGPAGGER